MLPILAGKVEEADQALPIGLSGSSALGYLARYTVLTVDYRQEAPKPSSEPAIRRLELSAAPTGNGVARTRQSGEKSGHNCEILRIV